MVLKLDQLLHLVLQAGITLEEVIGHIAAVQEIRVQAMQTEVVLHLLREVLEHPGVRVQVQVLQDQEEEDK